jgi:hypothetical protein
MASAADNVSDSDYTVIVSQYSNEELLEKERTKRRRKTGDMVGTGLSAVAAMAQPAMWTMAGVNVKSYLSSSSKHKIILKEMEKRGLEPLKEGMSDTLVPILSSAGGMYATRALGGSAAGQGVASMAGNLISSMGTKAFSSNKKGNSDKVALPISENIANEKKGRQIAQRPQSSPSSPSHQQGPLAAPSMYYISPGEMPPATLVYHYVPPSAQYPKGYYAPAPVQPHPQPVHHPQPVTGAYNRPQAVHPPQHQQQFPPAPTYQHYGQHQQQYYHHPQPAPPNLQRIQTTYQPAPGPQYALPRAQTMPYPG